MPVRSILILIAVVFLLAVIWFVVPYMYPKETDSDIAHTRQKLKAINAVIDRYKSQHGTYPSRLDDLINTDSEGLYFENDAIMNDSWNNRVKYKFENTKYILYSFGPNGVDDLGGGDDIMIK